MRQVKFQNIKRSLGVKSCLLAGVCVLLAISSILITIQSAASSMEVNHLEEKERVLLGQKTDLEEELVKNLSVSDLQTKSLDMGFAKPAELVYISESEPVANLPLGN